jgi:CRP/FNR family cyclic AMP-dependent transcriptional regulator
MADLGLKEVPARLASLILQLLETEGIVAKEGYMIPPRFTHWELGAMIGANRVAVTRAFAQLRRAGAVETRRRAIYVSRIRVLKRIAGGP